MHLVGTDRRELGRPTNCGPCPPGIFKIICFTMIERYHFFYNRLLPKYP
jgi:hypothetical protein